MTSTVFYASFKPYLDRRALTLLLLGFAAGIPILLIFSTLSLWLLEAGIERKTVTMFSWAALGYSFKFIWAPLVDALPLPLLSRMLGKRRAWLLASQILIIAAIVLMGCINPINGNPTALNGMALSAVLLGFSSATQDVVIDAYRIESAPDDSAMQAVMSSAYVAGYRLGMIAAGAGALYLASWLGSSKEHYVYAAWRNTYLIMALLMAACAAFTLFIREPNRDAARLPEQTSAHFSVFFRVAVLPLAAFACVWQLSGSLLPETLQSLKWLAALPAAWLPMRFSGSLHRNEPTAAKHLRLLLTFILCVSAFVQVFILLGKVLPASPSPFLSFIWESLRLMGAVASAVAVGVLTVRCKAVAGETVYQAWIAPLADFFRRYGNNALLLLALIGLYRISDIVAGVVSNVFYADLGFSKDEIATAVKIFGLMMLIAGGVVGGVLSQRYSVMKMMMLGAVLASVTNLMFVALAWQGYNIPMLYLAVGADNLAAGLTGTVFVAFLSSLTDIRFTAVQYALFSSLMTLIPKTLGGYSGAIADKIGYDGFFIFSALIGIPVLGLVWLAEQRLKQAEIPSNQG